MSTGIKNKLITIEVYNEIRLKINRAETYRTMIIMMVVVVVMVIMVTVVAMIIAILAA